MKNSYKIKIIQRAREDLDNIYRYISSELYAEYAAENLLERIEKSIMRLKDFPISCNYVADEFLRKKGYRKLIVNNYIVFYLVNEEEKQVVIMRVKLFLIAFLLRKCLWKK